MLAIQIQYIKKIILHDPVGFIPGMQGFFTIHKSISVIHHINKMEDKNHDHFNRCRKNIGQNSTSFVIKILKKVGIEGAYLNIIQAIYDMPTTNIFNSKSWKRFFWDWEQNKDAYSHHFYSA